MLIEGAHGVTENELKKALRLPDDREKTREILQKNQKALKVRLISTGRGQTSISSSRYNIRSSDFADKKPNRYTRRSE